MPRVDCLQWGLHEEQIALRNRGSPVKLANEWGREEWYRCGFSYVANWRVIAELKREEDWNSWGVLGAQLKSKAGDKGTSEWVDGEIGFDAYRPEQRRRWEWQDARGRLACVLERDGEWAVSIA